MHLSLVDFYNSFLPGSSFDAWRDVLRQIEGRAPLDRDLWNRIAGGREPLTAPPSEVYLAIGRGAAKSQTSALIAFHRAVTYQRPHVFSQRPFCLFIAGTDMRQAEGVLDYCKQAIDQNAALRALVESDPAKRVLTLKHGGVRFEVVPSDGAKLRGRGALCVVVDGRRSGLLPAG